MSHASRPEKDRNKSELIEWGTSEPDRKNPSPKGVFPVGRSGRPEYSNRSAEENRSVPDLPGTWQGMNTVQRIAWLKGQPGLGGATFKRRTRMFHAWVYSPTLAMTVYSAGCKVRDQLRSMVGGMP